MRKVFHLSNYYFTRRQLAVQRILVEWSKDRDFKALDFIKEKYAEFTFTEQVDL